MNCSSHSAGPIVGPPSSELLSLIDGDVFSRDERLSIYRNNVLSRLSETLKGHSPLSAELSVGSFSTTPRIRL